MKKIFISHNQSDAADLTHFKNDLKCYGFQCFEEQNCISLEEHVIERVRADIQVCDVFLYIDTEKSTISDTCIEQIEYAKSRNKKILVAHTEGNLPKLFSEDTHLIKYKSITNDLYYSSIIQLDENIEKCLKELKIHGISKTDDNFDLIYLKRDVWNDGPFLTFFNLHIKQTQIGYVKVGYVGQEENTQTVNKLPNFHFPCLGGKFFSRIFFEFQFNKNIENAIRFLLNDIYLMNARQRKMIEKEEVLCISLFFTRKKDLEDWKNCIDLST